MRWAPCSLVLACLAGCGGPPNTGSEAGVGSAPSCQAPDLITLIEGETVHRAFDLRTAPFGVLTGCNGSGTPGQVVFEIVVPAVGPHTVEARTAVPGTDRATDTVFSLRRTVCDTPVSDQCFDELSGDFRTNAAFTADGGDRVYLIMSTYSETTEGPVSVDISARPNGPPTITGAAVVVAGDQLLVDVDGGDPDGNATGVSVTLHGPAGELIDLDGDRLRDQADTLTGIFATPVTDTRTFHVRTRLPLDVMGGAARALAATSAYVRVVDSAGVMSVSDVIAPVRAGTIVGSGDACGPTLICPDELACAPGTFTCLPTPERVSACGLAGVLDVPVPTTTTTNAMAEGNLSSGPGLFTDSCIDGAVPVETNGREGIYRVVVPAGMFDLIATTDLTGTATGLDTVLYVRADCTDPTTGDPDWCNDDIVPTENLRSAVTILDVPEGDYFIFVERWDTVPIDTMVRYAVGASLRPVLPAGSACDPTETMNRCLRAPCAAASRMCP